MKGLNNAQAKVNNLQEATDHLVEAALKLRWAGALESLKLINKIMDEINKQLGAIKIELSLNTDPPGDPIWVRMDFPAGRPRSGERLCPMPPGPYLITSQFDQKDYQGMTLMESIKDHLDLITSKEPTSLGTVGYHIKDGKWSKCFYFYDTSD